MAILAFLLGGVFGTVSFLTALLLLDYSFLAAVGLYFSVGYGSALLIMALAWLPVWPRTAERIRG